MASKAAASKVAAVASKAGGATTAAGGKVVKGKVKLLVLSGEAKPGPAIGQALGPLGLNMAEFCKQFNAASSKMKPGLPTPVRLTAYADRTFAFDMKSPPVTWFLKKAANIDKASATPNLAVCGRVTLKQIYEIAKVKQADNPKVSIEGLCKMIVGSAKSMGLDVIEGRDVKPKPV